MKPRLQYLPSSSMLVDGSVDRSVKLCFEFVNKTSIQIDHDRSTDGG